MEIEHRHFDALVVGTGAGGSTTARELTKRGFKVLILERGGNRPVTGGLMNTLPNLLMFGQSALVTPDLMLLARAITTGGSTIYYYATAMEPPHDMFRALGIRIESETAETRQELGVGPLPEEWISPMSRRIMETAQGMGMAWSRMDKFIHADRLRGQSMDRWNWLGVPVLDAKWNGRMFVYEAVENGAAFLPRARVDRVLLEGSRAIGVEFFHDGKRRRAYADQVIVSAGGIGSPLILRRTGIKEAGNSFFYDPLVSVVGTVKDDLYGPEIPMSTGAYFPDDGYVMTNLSYHPLLFAGLTALGGKPHRILDYRRSMQIMVKIRDGLGGRLTDRGGVWKFLSPADRRRLDHGRKRAEAILRRAGAGNIYSTSLVAAHPGGTVKVGHLVDENLKTRLDGLYVCDCSVIPESWGLPPVLTLIALGKRLARHLTGK